MTDSSNGSTVPAEVQAQILTDYTTETPTPSRRQLASRYGLTVPRVQRILKRYDDEHTAQVAAEYVVAAMPHAVAEVKELTRNLPISKMCRVMEAAEEQYERHKDLDPHLAGGYLDQMRKCAIEMAKWLGIDKGLGVQDNTVRFEVEWRKGT